MVVAWPPQRGLLLGGQLNNLLLGVLITLSFWMTPAPEVARGYAVWYAPGVMEATCRYRGIDMSGYVDGIAMMSPADIGQEVWIKGPLGWEGPFIVCDCGVRGQVWEMVMVRGEVIEVGWRTASRWGLGPHDGGWKTMVTVSKTGPYSRDPLDNEWIRPVDYVKWFEDNAELEVCRIWVGDHDWAYCPLTN